MQGDLATTNLILGILAAVSVLEALVVIGLAIAGFVAYRRVMSLVNDVERRHVAPTMAKVNLLLEDVKPRVSSILEDVKSVSTTVKQETDRVNLAIHQAVNRVDDTADRVRSNVRAKTSRIVGFVRGARAAIETMLSSRAA